MRQRGKMRCTAAVLDLARRVERVERKVASAVSGITLAEERAQFFAELQETAARVDAIETKVKENVKLNKAFVKAVIDIAERVGTIERDLSNQSELQRGFGDLLVRMRAIEDRADEIVPRIEFFRGVAEIQTRMAALEVQYPQLSARAIRVLKADNAKLRLIIASMK